MLDRILPEQINNEFPGRKISLYGFLAFILLTIARSLAHILLPDGGAESIATIDLSVEGAEIIIGMFAQWGLSQLLMGVFYIIVYIRYRNLIPLMYVFIIMEYLGRILVGLSKPIETVGVAPGGIGNFIILPIAIVLLFLSIRRPTELPG